MIIHSDFTAEQPRWRPYEKLVNQPGARDGGFARVVPLNDFEVLKATCCPATNKLFDCLWQMHKDGKQLPVALPAITEKHKARLVADGQVFRLWTVERLFHATQLEDQKRARVFGKAKVGAFKPRYAKRLARQTDAQLDALQAGLKEESRYWARVGGSFADIALAMSLRAVGDLRETFLFLYSFLKEEELELDLLTEGNILVDMFGAPCLSDPVCAQSDTCPPSTEPRGEMCVGALVPRAIVGLKVEVEPRCTFGMPGEMREQLLRDLAELSIEGIEFEWGSAQHRAFLETRSSLRNIWSFPQAKQFLSEDKYLLAFCGN